ncbi:MAG: prenyltransferase/squalene oxidase repeat-containing protein [Candidatus Nanopelagicales bacterium]
MVKHHRTTLSTAALVAGALLLAGTAFAAPAATAATPAQPGLYGSGDPTYDGAFRQSLALLAHEAAGTTAPAAAVDWLVGQQCADGGFQAFRPSTAVACTPSDPNAFTGEDTNSTALAALALRSVGRTAEADRAIAWLEKARAADGGFPYFVGGASDANSTADVLIALNGAGAPGSSTGPARHYLETLQVGCDGAAAGEDGALAFQDYGTGLVANDAATVQSLVALAGSGLPVAPGSVAATTPRATCPTPVPAPTAQPAADLAAGYVARLLDAYSGAVPVFDFGTGSRKPGSVSAGDTAWAVLGLTAAGLGSAQRDAALAVVTAKAASAKDDPGLLALAALATHAAGGSASAVRAYVASIDATMRAAAVSPSPTPTATASASSTAGSGASTSATSDPTQAQNAAELPPTGSTPLTPVLVVAAALLLLAGLALVLGTRREGTHA